MKKPNLLLLVLFLALCSPLSAQDAQPDPLLSQQMSLSSAVRSALLDSRQQMILAENYSNMLQARIDSLETQSLKDAEELTRLSMHLTDTMNSFRSASAALDNSNLQLVQWKQKDATKTKLLWAGAILFLINVVGKVVMFILWAKGVKVPRWLDIII